MSPRRRAPSGLARPLGTRPEARRGADVAGYFDAPYALRRLAELLGVGRLSVLLAVSKPQSARWLCGGKISTEDERRILDLDYVVARALRVLHPDKVGDWLTYQVPTLGWARPIDVMATVGTVAVTYALDTLEEGAFL